jgi:Mrp family chromosome partitioning ATPase
MDAVVRTIEAGRAERERVIAAMGGAAQAVQPPVGDVGLSDTAVFKHRVIELDSKRMDDERILPPGATGDGGYPYKMLRTQVMRRMQELGTNTLAVLGASKGDGKTLTSINLAIAIAADLGHNALLVDLDLRNPSVHRRLGFEPDVGIDDCLLSRRPVWEAMVKVQGYYRLTILPARCATTQSSELIAGRGMADLIGELKTRYQNRILIFDLPPVLVADDALALSRHVQAGLFVVAEGRTSREDVKRSLVLLKDMRIVGTVLNRSRERAVSAY